LKAFVKGWTFGGRWKQLGNLYEHLNPNGRKRRKQHNKNYGNKIFMTVPKKLIRIINNKKVPWPFIMMQK
jgi:ribosomal protein L13E